MPIFKFLLLTFFFAAFFSAAAFSDASLAIDLLSKGPLRLAPAQVAAARAAYTDGLIYTDADCFLKTEDIQKTEADVTTLPAEICKSRTQEMVYVDKTRTLAACLSDKVEFAMRVSIGSSGLGKTRSGNRKSPFGTYWLGYPRHSELFGIFIPVGYPNIANIAAGYTGDAIGVHGPMRGVLNCHPSLSLATNWTAGCIAVSRDSQIIAVSEWVLAHWPVKITLGAY